MNDIDIFLNKHNYVTKSAKVSVLEPFRDEIFQLKNMGYAEKVIVEFLSEMKGVKVSRQALNQFIRSRMRNEQQGKTTAENLLVAEPTAHNATETPPELKKPRPQLKKGIKKFDWKNATTDGLT